jgi:hypothetical protein
MIVIIGIRDLQSTSKVNMDKLKLRFKNCYGINSFDHEFDLSTQGGKPKAKAYAIYAPNGVMKTSFARIFSDLAVGECPKEERYNRKTTCEITADAGDLPPETIFVLKSEIDIKAENPAITNILVDPRHKAKYDELILDQENQKTKLIRALQRISGVKQAEIETTILSDLEETDFPGVIVDLNEVNIVEDYSNFKYATLFDPKSLQVLESPEFLSKADEFSKHYMELFEKSGSIYKKGVFNPARAKISFSTLDKQGFFAGGHRVHLKDEDKSIDQEELEKKLEEIHSKIDSDQDIKKLRESLAKNAQTQALTDLLEKLSSSDIEFLLEKLKPTNQKQFKKDLWAYYIQTISESEIYIKSYNSNKEEINEIEEIAKHSSPKWNEAIELFNDRFVDMPFILTLQNQTETILGKEKAELKFVFMDGDDEAVYKPENINSTLSEGERRALYLLYFIFEVEARKLSNQETIFIIDDIADSFDYKNKHAIVQYLDDLTKISFFYQIILTHNFDFFRSVAISFVHRNRCLMTSKNSAEIKLIKAEGIRNLFINMWKPKVHTDNRILCASIPFTRNLIEYIKGEGDRDYLKLTSLLHWKEDTDQITVGEYICVFNRIFGTTHDEDNQVILKEMLYSEARNICEDPITNGLDLESKIFLSVAIRMKAEEYLTTTLRNLKNDSGYWYSGRSQFGGLIKEYSSQNPDSASLRILNKISVTVSSNIHLNSFMYEPILDLTLDHLIDLYNEVDGLNA